MHYLLPVSHVLGRCESCGKELSVATELRLCDECLSRPVVVFVRKD